MAYKYLSWGVPCSEISAAGGTQRIKGLSVAGFIRHAVGSLFDRFGSLEQKDTETSLIERFMHPKHSPEQLWEQFAQSVRRAAGEVRLEHRVTAMRHDGGRIYSVTVCGPDGGSQ